jgi:dTDP-4-amino-4,6-dideoxygalactose transaminase
MIEYENLAKLNEPYCTEFKTVFGQVLESGWFILGNQVKEFEEKFATYLGINHCVGVASGLDALELAIQALDIEKGSEIIVPSNTYIATILAILNTGHIPVLVEPDENTYNINPENIPKAITKKTKAVLVVHLYGKPCDMDKIIEICQSEGLLLIEDCAQSHGAKYNGKTTGTFGQVSAFSFYPTKNLGCLGDGGAITTDDSTIYEKLKKLRNYGSNKKYYNEYIGTNSRLDEIQAAFLLVKLKYLDELNKHKRLLASIYFNNLKGSFKLPMANEGYFDVYHIFNVLTDKRDELREYLLQNGIKTEIHYPVPPHKQVAMKNIFKFMEYPISEKIHSQCLSLPVSAMHSEKDIFKVVEVMNKFH